METGDPVNDLLKPRRVSIPAFTLTTTNDDHDEKSVGNVIPIGHGKTSYRASSYPVGHPDRVAINNMQIVVDRHGAPWHEACLYLLARVSDAIDPVATSTLVSTADDLVAFRKFIDDEGIDYKVFAASKHSRPTYRYRGFLMIMVRAGEIATSTAKRRLQSVLAFYRWLKIEDLVTPEHEMWSESDVSFIVARRRGPPLKKTAKTTDIAISSPLQEDPFADHIIDGGRLRPLPIDEQKALVTTLVDLGNTEMTLAHLIALFTGARMQTVLTLKVGNVSERYDLAPLAEIPIACGLGTTVDTKFSKKQTLFFPHWLYERLRTYSHSARAKKRRKRAVSNGLDSDYLFLSRNGNPLYVDKSEAQAFDEHRAKRYFPDGAALRVFIADRVIPAVREKLGSEFHYSFHDLRATFGMNLTDAQLILVDQEQVTLHQAREFVRVRMGHESSATTDAYLKFRQDHEFVKNLQSQYETHLSELIESSRPV